MWVLINPSCITHFIHVTAVWVNGVSLLSDYYTRYTPLLGHLMMVSEEGHSGASRLLGDQHRESTIELRVAWVVTVLGHRAHKQLVGSKPLCGCSSICTMFPGSTHKFTHNSCMSVGIFVFSRLGYSGTCLQWSLLREAISLVWSLMLVPITTKIKYLLKTITCLLWPRILIPWVTTTDRFHVLS